MASVLVDTSAVYAIIDRADQNHAQAKLKLKAMRKRRLEPLLTNFLVAESHALLLTRLGHAVSRAWLLANVWRVEAITVSDEQRARDIIRTHVDKDYSYTDASSFAIMERLGLRDCFTFDRHFAQYGFDVF